MNGKKSPLTSFVSRGLAHSDALAPADSDTDASTRRTRRLRVNVAATVASRVVAMAVPLTSIPITVGYLGDARFGVWTTLMSAVGWFAILDLGLTNALRNQLAVTFARGDRGAAGVTVSTAFCFLASVALCAGLLLLSLGTLVDIPALFNARGLVRPGEIESAALIVLASLLARLPLALVTVIYSARQEQYVASVWEGLGALLSLAAIYLAARTKGGLIALALAAGGVPLLVSIAAAGYMFLFRQVELRPSLKKFDSANLRGLLKPAVQFLAIQSAALVIYQTDAFIIARVLGPTEVTEYTLVMRLCLIVTALQGMVMAPLWPAYSEAVAKFHLAWVTTQLRRMAAISTAASLGFGVLLAFGGRTIIAIWSGTATPPSNGLLLSLALWTVLFVWQNNFAIFLNAIGAVRIQSILAVLGATLNIPLCLAGARYFGGTGVALANVLTMCVGAVQGPWETSVRLRELHRKAPKASP